MINFIRKIDFKKPLSQEKKLQLIFLIVIISFTGFATITLIELNKLTPQSGKNIQAIDTSDLRKAITINVNVDSFSRHLVVDIDSLPNRTLNLTKASFRELENFNDWIIVTPNNSDSLNNDLESLLHKYFTSFSSATIIRSIEDKGQLLTLIQLDIFEPSRTRADAELKLKQFQSLLEKVNTSTAITDLIRKATIVFYSQEKFEKMYGLVIGAYNF